MDIKAIKAGVMALEADLLVLGAFEDAARPTADWKTLDAALGGALTAEAEATGFKGAVGKAIQVNSHGRIAARRVLAVGLGKRSSFGAEEMRRFGAAVAKRVSEYKRAEVACVMPEAPVKAREAARAVVEGVLLASYRYDKYHDEKKRKEREEDAVKSLTLVFADLAKAKQAAVGIAEAELATEGACLARDLVNEPASVATPSHLAEHARRIASESGGKVQVEISDHEECEKLGMGAFLAVAAGATEEPRFIHLSYRPRGAKKSVAIVGKGITFDSGGLQTKPGDSMATMKCDMSGAAAVLGLFSVISRLGLKHEVHGIIAATENMPGKNAYKPGDIVRAMDGKTIEIGHTDAEGRVTLADALAYAVSKEPDMIIDLATLTGACVVALGEEIAGLMGNDAKLVRRIEDAAAESGERVWEMPLAPEYDSLVKSDVADVKNISSTRYGGTLTAGLFLQNFVGETPWAHLDIAGPAYAERESVPYVPKGGSGFGVRTLIALLKRS